LPFAPVIAIRRAELPAIIPPCLALGSSDATAAALDPGQHAPDPGA
jgi:hypothetical protein